jgi:4-hydroxythreonine-4-phosphate dehydrogenase
MSRPRIAITIGDPAGIGAEVALKALAHATDEDRAAADWLLIGDPLALAAAALVSGIDISKLPCTIITRNTLANEPLRFGELNATYGLAAVDYVRHATEMCLRGEADALVTAPLNKEAVTLSGMAFTGHTEYIAQLCNATESRMLLVSEKLATVHVTTHIALEQACKVDKQRVIRTIELGDAALRLMLGRAPRIGVCGLNPHAGEHNLFGRQDSETIAPAIAEAAARDLDCSGPHPADTIFLRGLRGDFDLIVAMYHDQGHIPMKLIDFESTVNVSLGIPVIRTSVDHGTAFDIAGKNLADPRNMLAAMRLAARMATGKLTAAPLVGAR